MDIQLKNISHHARLSEETECYSASLWVDGVKIGDVSNRGHGGGDEFYGDHVAYARADAWCKVNLPHTEFDGHDLGPQTLEDHCGALLSRYLMQRDLQRAMRGRVLTIEDGRVMETRFKGCRKVGPERIAHVRSRAPDAKILNDMPFAKALELYEAHA